MTSYPKIKFPIETLANGPEVTGKGQVLAFHTIATGEKRDRVMTYAVIQTDENELIQQNIKDLTVID